MSPTKKVYTPDFLQIPQIVMHLPPAERFVFGAVYFYAQLDEKKCRASNVTLSRVANITEASVANCLIKLEEAGFIKRFFKDEGKRHRDYIICLVSFARVPSTDVSRFIKGCIPDSSGDEQNITIKEVKNTDQGSETYNREEEIQKLLDYKQYWLNIIGAYLKFKRVPLENKKQQELITKKFYKVAHDLEAYPVDRIKAAMVSCSQIIDKKTGEVYDWTLYTVLHQLTK